MGLIILLGIIVFIILYCSKSKKKSTPKHYQHTDVSKPYIPHDSHKDVDVTTLGIQGEYSTYKILETLDGYNRILSNVYIPKRNGETTELDIILLHKTGIYVFESKNYSGWIFGSETHQYWTQTLPIAHGESQKTQFYNPILQNKGHIKWLRLYLNDSSIPIYSYIVFSNQCTLKEIELTSGNHYVIQQSDILSAVKEKITDVNTSLSTSKIDELYEKLSHLTNPDESIKISHNLSVQKIKQQDNLTEGSKCPICGGTLVKRVASKGPNKGSYFLGCSGYHYCKFTVNIKTQN